MKEAHYEAMKLLEPTLTDEEIEEDYKQLCKDLGILHDELEKYIPVEDKNDIPF